MHSRYRGAHVIRQKIDIEPQALERRRKIFAPSYALPGARLFPAGTGLAPVATHRESRFVTFTVCLLHSPPFQLRGSSRPSRCCSGPSCCRFARPTWCYFARPLLPRLDSPFSLLLHSALSLLLRPALLLLLRSQIDPSNSPISATVISGSFDPRFRAASRVRSVRERTPRSRSEPSTTGSRRTPTSRMISSASSMESSGLQAQAAGSIASPTNSSRSVFPSTLRRHADVPIRDHTHQAPRAVLSYDREAPAAILQHQPCGFSETKLGTAGLGKLGHELLDPHLESSSGSQSTSLNHRFVRGITGYFAWITEYFSESLLPSVSHPDFQTSLSRARSRTVHYVRQRALCHVFHRWSPTMRVRQRGSMCVRPGREPIPETR